METPNDAFDGIIGLYDSEDEADYASRKYSQLKYVNTKQPVKDRFRIKKLSTGTLNEFTRTDTIVLVFDDKAFMLNGLNDIVFDERRMYLGDSPKVEKVIMFDVADNLNSCHQVFYADDEFISIARKEWANDIMKERQGWAVRLPPEEWAEDTILTAKLLVREQTN